MTQAVCYPHLHPLFANGFDARIAPMIRHHLNLLPPEHLALLRKAAMPYLRKVQKRLERRDKMQAASMINAQARRGITRMDERYFALLPSGLQSSRGASRLVSAAFTSAQRFARDATALRRAQSAVDKIIQRVARERNVLVPDILSIRRARPAILARQEVFYCVRLTLGLSYPDIGALFSRDHSSVMNGVAAHARRNGLPHPDDINGTRAVPKRQLQPRQGA